MPVRRNPNRGQPSGARAALRLATTLWTLACGVVILARAAAVRASWFFWLVGAAFLALGAARIAEALRCAKSAAPAPGAARQEPTRGGDRP